MATPFALAACVFLLGWVGFGCLGWFGFISFLGDMCHGVHEPRAFAAHPPSLHPPLVFLVVPVRVEGTGPYTVTNLRSKTVQQARGPVITVGGALSSSTIFWIAPPQPPQQ